MSLGTTGQRCNCALTQKPASRKERSNPRWGIPRIAATGPALPDGGAGSVGSGRAEVDSGDLPLLATLQIERNLVAFIEAPQA